MPDLPARRLGNRPGLTGLRAVAITVVVARHTGEVWPGGFDGSAFGFAGVDIFFVLSGFLITSLLVGELWRTGSISLGQFYIRRALRLLPALFAFLLVVLILTPFEPDVRTVCSRRRSGSRPSSWGTSRRRSTCSSRFRICGRSGWRSSSISCGRHSCSCSCASGCRARQSWAS